MPRQRVKGGQKNPKSGKVWSENEIKSVLQLYLDLGGKGLHEFNPAIISLGEKLGRTTRSVEYQLLMFRNLDRDGVYSVGKMNTLCKRIWDEYKNQANNLAKNLNGMNQYPFAFEKWKSASAGGVRRPFDKSTGRPTKNRIETAITSKLNAIIEDTKFPKAVFLVGGPGNGKTDTLEYLVNLLDEHYLLEGQLVDLAKRQFSTYGRKVILDVTGIDSNLPFEEIQLVQDASEREKDCANAAESLLADFDQVLSTEFKGIYICCVNRGILDNLRRLSLKLDGKHLEYIKVLQQAISPALPKLILYGNEVDIWPVTEPFPDMSGSFTRTFIWPMDVDSLFVNTQKGNIPFHDLLNHALDEEKWEFESDTYAFRPIFESYELLRGQQAQKALLYYLRSYELLAGIRFTFRDMLSFIAYIFHCSTYDRNKIYNQKINESKSFVEKFAALHELYTQLYFVKVFPWEISRKDVNELLQRFIELKAKAAWDNDKYSALTCLKVILKQRARYEGSYIERVILSEQFKELDPARSVSEQKISGTNISFQDIDQLFSRGIHLGLNSVKHLLSPTENEYISMLKEIEENSLGGDDVNRNKSSYLPLCVGFFRKYAAILCKRSIGLKYGITNHREAAEAFISAFEKGAALAELKEQVLKALFPDEKLKISFCSGIGQPTESLTGDAYLNLGNLTGIEGLLKQQYTNLPTWDILYLQIEKGKAKADLQLNFSTYLKIIKLAKLNVLPGCIPPDLLMWKDAITSSLSSFEIRELSKLCNKSIELTNGANINIDYNGNLKIRLV